MNDIFDYEDDDMNVYGHYEFAPHTPDDRDIFETSSKGLASNSMAGFKSSAGQFSEYNGGTLTFTFSEFFDGSWYDPTRIPSGGSIYLDGYVGSEYILCKIDVPYAFDNPGDNTLSIQLAADSFQKMKKTFFMEDLSPEILIEDTIIGSFTQEEFEEFLSGEVGIYFRMAANEAVYNDAPPPDPITFLKSVGLELAPVPEPAGWAAFFGLGAFAFAAWRRGKSAN